jgi:hypothetical protein
MALVGLGAQAVCRLIAKTAERILRDRHTVFSKATPVAITAFDVCVLSLEWPQALSSSST